MHTIRITLERFFIAAAGGLPGYSRDARGPETPKDDPKILEPASFRFSRAPSAVASCQNLTVRASLLGD